MRYQGKLIEWNDDKAFGFVMPNAGGRKIFLHLNEFLNQRSARRPRVGDLLTFEVGLDEQKRSCAKNVSFVVAPDARRQTEGREVASKWNQWVALVWIAAVLLQLMHPIFPWKFVALWSVLNVVTYVMYVSDKSAAARGKWRTPESQLHLLSLLGGWPAAAIAQQRLRHKTSKAEFRIVFWFTVTANIAAMLWLALHGESILLAFK